MARYRRRLPQLSGELFITDGGLETDLIFHHGYNLPCNASYTLLDDQEGAAALDRYFEGYLEIARDYSAGLLLESATWRASADWGAKLGTSAKELVAVNQQAIASLASFRKRLGSEVPWLVISGCIGPRSDAYRPTHIMTAEEAQAYHAPQIEALADADADLITAMTLTNVPEAIGIALATKAARSPVVLSFTVETDGLLPSGQSLRDAIETVDAETDGAPAYYMINCAHPTHFSTMLEPGEAWTGRIRGLRANASIRSHAELDESTELDEGNPFELGGQYRDLIEAFPHINVLGGCCGTDHRHVRAIAEACADR